MIRATGTLLGTKITLEITMKDGKPTVDDDWYQERLDTLMESVSIGGTYFPPKNSIIAAIAALEDFFDDYPVIEAVDEDIPTIPHEDGVVY